MKGYKIAYVIENDGDFEVRYPALVILDISDNAAKITPEDRFEMGLRWDGHVADRNWESLYHSYIKYRHHSDKALFNEYLEKSSKVKLDRRAKALGVNVYGSWSERFKDEFMCISRFIHASKCRASHAKVVDIIGLMDNEHHTHANSFFDDKFVYTVGEDVSPSSGMFNANEFDICGSGIHYFETATLAVLFAIDGISGGNSGMYVGQIHAKFMAEQLEIFLGNGGDCGERSDFYVRDESYKEGDIDERT